MKTQRNALLLERIQAITIDTLLIIFLMYTFSIAFELIGNVSASVRKWSFLSLFLFYEPVATAFGTTLGNYLMRIRVRRNANELKRINIFQAFLRYLFKTLFGWLSFLSIFFNKRNRAIHDYLSGSVMIKLQ